MTKKFTRRDVFGIGAGLAAAGITGLPTIARSEDMSFKPEEGAKLRVLRWKRFVQGDEDLWEANTRKFTETTGIPVKLEYESWEDVRPKAAVAANIGSGPDIIIGWYDDPHQYPDKLVDVSDVAGYLGKKYGGWYPAAETYGTRDGKWIALPMGAAGANIVYRKSMVNAAGFDSFPGDTDGFLKLCQALAKKGTPAGFALGHAVGDGNQWCHWLLWSFGGKMVDENNQVVLESPETLAALEYAVELYKTFIPGTLSWQDAHNNKAFLSSKISLTSNGISIYYAAKSKGMDIKDDIYHANMPVGPVGKPMELYLFTQAMLFKYSRFPNAAKEYLRFMWEKPQYEPWQAAANGYITQPLRAYESNPIWTSDPKNTPYRDCVKRMQVNGYAGTLGYASAAAMADFIVVDMIASAASGQATPKEAMAQAAKRARRYYS